MIIPFALIILETLYYFYKLSIATIIYIYRRFKGRVNEQYHDNYKTKCEAYITSWLNLTVFLAIVYMSVSAFESIILGH